MKKKSTGGERSERIRRRAPEIYACLRAIDARTLIEPERLARKVERLIRYVEGRK